MATKTLSIAYQALTHAWAYAENHARNVGYHTEDYENGKVVREPDPIYKLINGTKNITELNRLLATYVGEEIKRTDAFDPSYGCDVNGFYVAMKKTIPFLIDMGFGFDNGKDAPTREHSGTECRGWYRVYGAIKLNTKYFADWELGRDQFMAQLFYKAGAITTEEYDVYKTSITLNMMAGKVFQTNNFPDPIKIRDYWQKDLVEQILDMRLIRMLETA